MNKNDIRLLTCNNLYLFFSEPISFIRFSIFDLYFDKNGVSCLLMINETINGIKIELLFVFSFQTYFIPIEALVKAVATEIVSFAKILACSKEYCRHKLNKIKCK